MNRSFLISFLFLSSCQAAEKTECDKYIEDICEKIYEVKSDHLKKFENQKENWHEWCYFLTGYAPENQANRKFYWDSNEDERENEIKKCISKKSLYLKHYSKYRCEQAKLDVIKYKNRFGPASEQKCFDDKKEAKRYHDSEFGNRGLYLLFRSDISDDVIKKYDVIKKTADEE